MSLRDIPIRLVGVADTDLSEVHDPHLRLGIAEASQVLSSLWL
jgi:hypothetical protein